jgi:hypothetical protein
VASFARLWRAGRTGRGRGLGAGKEAATTAVALGIRRGARGGRCFAIIDSQEVASPEKESAAINLRILSRCSPRLDRTLESAALRRPRRRRLRGVGMPCCPCPPPLGLGPRLRSFFRDDDALQSLALALIYLQVRPPRTHSPAIPSPASAGSDWPGQAAPEIGHAGPFVCHSVVRDGTSNGSMGNSLMFGFRPSTFWTKLQDSVAFVVVV